MQTILPQKTLMKSASNLNSLNLLYSSENVTKSAKSTCSNLNNQFKWLENVVWIKCFLKHSLWTSPEWFWLITARDFSGPKRARLLHPLDSAKATTMGKSKGLSIDLKGHIIDLTKSGKSFGAISKQLQVPRSTVQTAVWKCKVNGTFVSGRKHKLSPAAERKLVRMVKSQLKTTKKQVCNELEAAARQVSVSTVKCVLLQHELRSCWTHGQRKSPWAVLPPVDLAALKKVKGIMTRGDYLQILQENLKSSAED